MEYWRSSRKKSSKSGNSYFVASLFLPSSWFLRACNKKGKVACKTQGTDRLDLWSFVSSLRGYLSTTWVILENWSALCKANFCKGGRVWEQLGGVTADRQCGTNHFLRASGYGERTRQGVKETKLEVATAQESLVAMYLQPCSCANLLRRPAALFNWLRVSDSIRILVSSLTMWLRAGADPTEPQERWRCRIQRPASSTSWGSGALPSLTPGQPKTGQRDPLAACSQAAQVKKFFQVSRRNLPNCGCKVPPPPAVREPNLPLHCCWAPSSVGNRGRWQPLQQHFWAHLRKVEFSNSFS